MKKKRTHTCINKLWAIFEHHGMHDDHRFNLNIFLLNKNTIGVEHNFHNFDRPLPQSTKKLYIKLILYVFISFFISAIFIHWFNLINELWNCIIICMFMSYWPNQKYVVITWHIYFCLKKINSNRLVYNLCFSCTIYHI